MIRLLLGAATAAALAACGSSAPPATPTPSGDLGTTLQGGRTVTLASLRGHPVVLSFWGSWCGPCHDEQPRLDAAYTRWSPKGVQFLGVDLVDTDSGGRAFVAQYHVPYPSVVDPNGDIAMRYLIPSAPAIVFLDAAGRVHSTVLGGLEILSDAQFDATVASLLPRT